MDVGIERKALNVSLPAELYRKVEKLAKEKAKPKSELVREVIRQYVEAETRWKQIGKRGRLSAKRLRIDGPEGVESFVEQYRKEKAQ